MTLRSFVILTYSWFDVRISSRLFNFLSALNRHVGSLFRSCRRPRLGTRKEQEVQRHGKHLAYGNC
jgi:hypothetical protein